ncbi:MAG TPA: hypothetical protein VE377_03120 [Candidatus Dormibacteraeota bacterium]|nr:hypothetical protein [Candidatus Dormibacteraeota bacterium]
MTTTVEVPAKVSSGTAPEYAGLIDARELRRSLERLQQWIESHHYCGYEPFDGLSSWARPLAFGNQLGERILQQLIRQSPFNLRPLFGIRPQESTKGRGYIAHGYLFLYRATRERECFEKARLCLEWLDQHKSPSFEQHSWSNHFDFVSRGGSYTKNDPIIVWTVLIGHAYVEAFELTGNEWFLSIARSACEWIMALPREKTPQGDCISYRAHVQSSIHNSNMLGASLLARVAKYDKNEEYLRVARSAMEYSCSRQLSDGAWWYGEDPKYHWIDNFHTGYNVDSLDCYISASKDMEFVPNLNKGLEFYKAHFFEESGRPRYYHTRTYPVDIQCIAQSIDTLSGFSQRDPASFELAQKVAVWAIKNMQDKKGYFYYRQYPLIKAKTPMLHWGQGTMFKALSRLLFRLEARRSAQ